MDMVSARAKPGEHFTRVRGITRLSEDFAAQLDGGVRAHDNAIAQDGANFRGSGARFCFREPRNHPLRRFSRKRRLVNVGGANFKWNSRFA